MSCRESADCLLAAALSQEAEACKIYEHHRPGGGLGNAEVREDEQFLKREDGARARST